MKLEEYKSGEYVKMNDYKAFIPSKINYNWGWDDTKLDKKPFQLKQVKGLGFTYFSFL